jgi:hypothetical protein
MEKLPNPMGAAVLGSLRSWVRVCREEKRKGI